MKKHMKSSDGKYHIKGHKYDILEGSRAQVWHGSAYKTSGGLTRDKLYQNKRGRIVSRKKYTLAKREKRLEQHGYYAKKGKFGAVERGVTKHKKSKKRKTKSTKSSKSKKSKISKTTARKKTRRSTSGSRKRNMRGGMWNPFRMAV